MTETILFVDDEENVLRSIERLFSEKELNIRCASNANCALSILEKENVAVIVSDNMMPGMSGLDLLCQVRDISPFTIKVLMTAYADLTTAVEAINKTEIFRFVLKPWDNYELEWIVDECLARYRAALTISKEEESTLLSLARMVELKDPYTRGHCERVGEYAVSLASRLGLRKATLKEIRHGSWLHDCGKIGVPEEILNFKGPLDERQYEVVKRHPRWGAEVVQQAGLSKRVTNIVLHHHERFDGKGYPLELKGRNVPFEARIVSVADVYDSLITDRPYRKAISKGKALQVLFNLKGNVLDPEIVDIFLDLFAK